MSSERRFRPQPTPQQRPLVSDVRQPRNVVADVEQRSGVVQGDPMLGTANDRLDAPTNQEAISNARADGMFAHTEEP